jgi:hypothetical protein
MAKDFDLRAEFTRIKRHNESLMDNFGLNIYPVLSVICSLKLNNADENPMIKYCQV